MEYRVIGRNNGDTIFVIAIKDTDDTLGVLFPMLVKQQVVQIAPDKVRETWSASQLCPFTDDRYFEFYKPELSYMKTMNEDAIEYYVSMLNRHETKEILAKYNLHSIIEPDEEVFIADEEELVEEASTSDVSEASVSTKVIH